MIPAAVAVQRPPDARLMVVDASGQVVHKRRADFPALVRSRDLVIANDAATLPASLSGTHLATGSPIELRLAGRRSPAGLSPSNLRPQGFSSIGDSLTAFAPAERRSRP